MTKDNRSRGIYILPNLFTISALFAGFYAVIAAMNGFFDNAAIAIFIAMVMDSLDGRIARLTNTQTSFGAQLDSLSDMVSFGIAPALVIYNWGLQNLGKLGWLIAFLYAVAVALRLARFNTQVAKADKRYFQGLACTVAAGVVAGMIWCCTTLNLDGIIVELIGAALTLIVSVLMVSNIRYRSFKDLDLKGNVSFVTILVIVLVLVLVAIAPSKILFVIFLLYTIAAPIMNLKYLHEKRRAKKIARQSQSAK